MNDFAKEELQWIYNEIRTNVIGPHCYLDENTLSSFGGHLISYIEGKLILSPALEMALKIKNMIDNYCDHEEQYEDVDYQPMRCKKCLEITG